MTVHVQVLRRWDGLEEVFRQDGWAVGRDHPGDFEAEHPDVEDEAAARSRLHQLGLLTSPLLRIEFEVRLHE